MVVSRKESKNKSSRAKADLFEVLIALGLRSKYRLEISDLTSVAETLTITLEKFRDGEQRIREQKQRATLALPKIIQELKSHPIFKKGKGVVKVDWVGRKLRAKEPLSDVDLLFKSGNSIGISLKSTRSGKGTQKNIGAKQLESLLGLDVTNEIEEMWKKIKQRLKERGGELGKLADGNITKIRENKYKFPVIQKIGEEFGRVVQKVATQKSLELFNALSLKQKRVFLGFIFGVSETKPLLNVLAEGDEIHLAWNDVFARILSTDNIKAAEGKENKGRGYYIYIEGKPIIRIQANFTNGIGLSPFCERAFLLI